MLNQFKYACSVIMFASLLYTTQTLAAEECASENSSIKIKALNIEKQIESVKFLIDKNGSPQFPLEVIFQVDVADSDQISRRLQEVRKLTEIDNVLKSKELADVSQCGSESERYELAKQVVNLNLLKVKFFEYTKDKRTMLVDSYVSQRALQTNKNIVDKEVQKTEAVLAEAQKKLNETSENLTSDSVQSKDEALVVATTALQQYLADYALEHLSFLKVIEEKKAALDKIRVEVNGLVQKEQREKADPKVLLHEVNLNWENTVDFISDLFKGIEVSTRINLPEALVPKSSFSEKESQEYSDYIKVYGEAKKGRLEQAEKRTQIVNDLRSQAFQLLTESGQLRARLFSECDQIENCDGHRRLNSKNLFDFAREIEIIPIKIQAGGIAKTLEFKSKFHAGVDGWIDLFQQVVALFVLLIIPMILFKLLSWLNLALDSTRRSILSRSMMDFRKRTLIALWISRINPFLPATGMTFGTWLARQLIETTDLKEVSQLLFYIQLYFIYRIFKMLVQISLEVLFSSESVKDLKKQRIKIENSAKRISRLIFVEYAFLFLIETTVRKALLYGLISNLIFYFNIIFAFWEAYRWNRQILNAYLLRFPSHEVYINKLTHSKILYFLLCPILLLTVASHEVSRQIYLYLIRLDVFKKIHSEIFRRRIEADAEDEVKKIPSASYLKQFDYYLPADKNILVKRDSLTSEDIVSTINSWRLGKTYEDLIIVVGNRGMGKTTVLNSISNSLSENVEVSRPLPKTTKKIAFYQFLSAALGAQVSSVEELIELDNQLQTKKVVLIDDVQNLFLGEIGGFEVYKMFVEILSLKTKNIFWCLSINSRSWSYLKGVFGKEHLYGKILELSSWKDSEIQELILKRHDLTGVSRQFDKSIKAYGASGDTLGQQAETQFFRLLWGQSRGNPRSALMYWISAVSQAESGDIVVGVPSFVNSSLVSSMSDDSLFLLASIARHESLTQDEMFAVTSIPNTVIRKCMKEALDKNLVWSDSSGRYRISSRAQYVIDYFLIGKNFLYE